MARGTMTWGEHRRIGRRIPFPLTVACLGGLLLVWIGVARTGPARAQILPPVVPVPTQPEPALPQVAAPFPGDPRLEPLPDHPLELVNLNVGANGRVLTMHFPPRVNGQTASDGDGHADMYVLFYSDTLLPVDQPRIVEAVPKNAAGAGVSVSDLDARNFSAIWELHAVLVDPTYDPKNPGRTNPSCVVNELTVGEVTAVTVFFMTLRAPDQLRNDPNLLALMGIPAASIDRGRNLFINPVDQGGAACASCHTPFQPLTGTQFVLTNPQTAFGLPLQVSFHVATQDEVTRGFATSVGQAGLGLYGDFKPHKMGARMFCSGTDSAKTAELWDVGSVFPYGRCGFFGSSLNDVILAHEGVSLSSVMVTKDPQFDFVDSAQIKKSSQRVTVKNTSSVAVAGPPAKPIRVTLVGKMTTGIRAANAVGTDPAGGRRQGAFWLINNDIPAGGSAMLTLEFENPSSQPLDYALAILDDVGDSEAVASAHAYRTLLSDSDRSDLINFLRVQLIDGKVGEGSGGNGK